MPKNRIDSIRELLDSDWDEPWNHKPNEWGVRWENPLKGDFNFVTPRLATGAGFYCPADVRELIDAGITHILDCRGEVNFTDELTREFPDLGYCHNGTGDDGKSKGVAYWRRSIDYGLAVLNLPDTVLYVHCQAGINRGPSSCYAVARAFYGWSHDAAIRNLSTARPRCAPGKQRWEGFGICYAKDADRALRALGYA